VLCFTLESNLGHIRGAIHFRTSSLHSHRIPTCIYDSTPATFSDGMAGKFPADSRSLPVAGSPASTELEAVPGKSTATCRLLAVAGSTVEEIRWEGVMLVPGSSELSVPESNSCNEKKDENRTPFGVCHG
jgi:hypothetical protein